MCAKGISKDVPQNFYRPKNERTQNWYVRLVPPTALKGHPDVAEYRKSTGTADLRRAKVIGAILIAEQRARWDQLLSNIKAPALTPVVLNAELIESICARRRYHWMRLDDEGRYEGVGYDDESTEGLAKICDISEKTMRSVLARGKSTKEWGEVLEILDFWGWQIGLRVERTDPSYPRLVRDFAKTDLESIDRILKRNRGEHAPTLNQPLTLGPTLSAMVEPYREYKAKSSKSKHPSTLVGIWKSFIEFAGDVPLSSVKSTELFDFLESRMSSEDGWSMKYAHGTVKRTLREVFALARTKGLMSSANPIDDLIVLPQLSPKVESERAKPRLPYSDEQLSGLFRSEWYDPTSSRWRGKMGTDLGARYWVPLVCLFHGNRVREVLQLVASDIEASASPPVIHWREEIEVGDSVLERAGIARSLKNSATHRTVPIHPKLIELGFLKFVRERLSEDGPNALLFPSSLPNPGGRTPMLGRSNEQAFLRFVRDTLGFGSGFGNHSFRHQLEDRIRNAQSPSSQWPPGLAQGYTGRKRLRPTDIGVIQSEGSESSYGRGHSSKLMLRYIQSLDFNGIEMPPKYSQWKRDQT